MRHFYTNSILKNYLCFVCVEAVLNLRNLAHAKMRLLDWRDCVQYTVLDSRVFCPQNFPDFLSVHFFCSCCIKLGRTLI
jgi:hypothetical protein